MLTGKVYIHRLLFVRFFVCMVTDFSNEDKASGVSVLGREYLILRNFAPPEAQNRTNLRAGSGRRIGMYG